MWAAVTDGPLAPAWQIEVQLELDSLRRLSKAGSPQGPNPDGWGIGYYATLVSGEMIPVISRGGACAADDDIRYGRAAASLALHLGSGGIAHIRHGSSGPEGVYPDPHPFYRRTLYQDFDMLFAHNGHVSIEALQTLLGTYATADSNVPDYAPNVDSDLYAIYMTMRVDREELETIDDCILDAIADLAVYLRAQHLPRYLNCVLTDGHTLWAVRYTDENEHYTLYYLHTPGAAAATYVVASTPLSTPPIPYEWAAMPNHCLLILRPNEVPAMRALETEPDATLPISRTHSPLALKSIAPNPGGRLILLSIRAAMAMPCRVTLFSADGRSAEIVFDGYVTAGDQTITLEIPQLAAGVYFARIQSPEVSLIRKVILLGGTE